MARIIKIGTRGSPLALAQTGLAEVLLKKAHPGLATETVIIKTSGDKVQDRALAEVGGKGLFVKEIEEAMIKGAIDIAVHSMKDVPTFLPDGLEIAAMLPRADVRDVLFARNAKTFADLPKGAVVGTSSPRRQAIVLALRPDLKVVLFRGNVETRLRKFDSGEVDATILAAAGLARLGLKHGGVPLDIGVMLPAAGQGAVGIELRSGDAEIKKIVEAINDAPTRLAVEAERGFLAVMDGSCRSPLAAHAAFRGDRLHLKALAARPDGSELWEDEAAGLVSDRAAATALGRGLGEKMKKKIPADYAEERKRA